MKFSNYFIFFFNLIAKNLRIQEEEAFQKIFIILSIRFLNDAQILLKIIEIWYRNFH